MSDLKEQISSVLLNLRLEKGVSQGTVADATGIIYTQISKWESGKVVPSKRSLAKMADYYGTTVDEIYRQAEQLKDNDEAPDNDEGPPWPEPEPKEIDEDLLAKVIEGIERGLDEMELELEPGKKAQLVILLYKHFSVAESDVETKTVREYLKLVA